MDETGTPLAEAPSAPVALTFEEMDLSPEVRRAIQEELRYARPTPVQSACFGPIREDKDVVVQSRTGTGKTAAFGFPLADRVDPSVPAVQLLVLAPTRELANQDAKELERINRFRGNRVLPIYGGAAFGPQLDGLRAGSQIVAGTPGRVLDHLKRGTLKLDQLRFFILDEADEMLSMGFQDELEAILAFVPEKRQTMLFSATFPPEIKRIISKYLVAPHEILLSQGNISVDEITHYYYVTGHMQKPNTLLRLIEYEEPDSAIVFCNTREEANFVGTFLANRGHDADVLTGELTQSQRERTMAKIKGGNLQYLVATDVAARGIDINDLSHVINYNLPESPEVYVHRTGRTGRAGKSGIAVSIVSGLDISTLHALTKWMKIKLEERPIPTDVEVKAHRLDREVKRIVAEARGRIEEGRFADPENRAIQVAEVLLGKPEAKEIVATLLEKIAAGPPPTPKKPHVIEPEVSEEQKEFESRQSRRNGRESQGYGPAGRDRDRDRRGPRGDRGGRDRERPPRHEGRTEPRRDEQGSERPSRSASPPAGDSKTLMITLGKRHRMRAREVGMFVVQNAGIEIPQVRDVRVRDGYSFVDVDPAVVEKVLAGVNGKEVAGRPVKAEIARRQRGEPPPAPAGSAPAAPEVAPPPSDGNAGEGGS